MSCKLMIFCCTLLAFALAGTTAPAQDGMEPTPSKKVEETPGPPAGPEKPKEKGPVSMDELSKELLEAWAKKQYNLGRAGAKQASYKIAAKMEVMGQVMECKGDYSWDGKAGSLTWDNAQLGGMLAEQGWSATNMDSNFRTRAWLEQFDGATLTAKRDEKGTVVTVKTGKPAGIREVHFDNNGVMTGMKMEAPNKMGGTMEIVMDLSYKQEGGQYINTGWSFKGELPQGTYSEKTTITSVKAGDFFIITKAVADGKMSMPGGEMAMKKTLTFTDWKINGQALGGEAAAGAMELPEDKGKKTEGCGCGDDD
ncbi:MAG: hypothetical protein ACE10D_07940 [Planctomycetota bacterium]